MCTHSGLNVRNNHRWQKSYGSPHLWVLKKRSLTTGIFRKVSSLPSNPPPYFLPGPFPGSRKSTIETHLQNVLVYDTLYVALLYMVGDFEEQIRNNSKCQKTGIFIIWHKEKPRWAEGLKLSWILGSMKLIWDDTPRWAEERVCWCWCFQGRNYLIFYM